ncbi:pre-peptidase C-terminal domain-containing protein [Croceibacterium ferulae]|uniref:pre-peptidase C-terminal domain-containing protein n=1 Tax=Croceibacterium ferulae TaxID=1854641 RepID=UPI000EB40F5E|nr:pre-peptidase C-terminal domain-containing protein [Croceibacterium ferulae]
MRRVSSHAVGLLLASAAIVTCASPVLAQHDVTGTLANGDATLDSGEFYDSYDIDGRAGDILTVRVGSSDFDAYVFVRGPQDSAFSNDDAEGGGSDAGLTVTLPADGTYTIFATSYASGETGSYRLVSSLDRAGSGAVTGAGAGGAGVLVAGGRAQGTLAAGDDTLQGGEFVDSFTLQGEPGSRVVLNMRSDTFDTYLHVSGDDGYEVFNDDAPGGSGDSQLEAQFPASGRLSLLATSFAAGEQGAYTITMEAVASGGGVPAGADAAGTALTLGTQVTGSLPGGSSYQLEGQAGQTVRLSLSSEAFDPVLRLAGPDGFTASNDDSPAGDTLDSLLEVTLPASGTYHLTVGTYSGEGAGAFRLAASAGEQAVAQADQPPAGRLTPGRSVSGSLAASDQTFSSGEYQDRFTFQGRRGDRVVFDMQSADFDTFLSLYLPDGGIETNDDRAGDEGTDSRLAITLPQDGSYEIAATSYAAAQTGSYTLRMGLETGADAPVLADAGGAGRVFLLSVGVADYQRASPLSLTDGDAAKLTQTLSAMGVLAPGSVTLLNAEATRGAVQSAFGRIAAQIGPDDLFLMFFSGHGSKESVDTIMEGDGSAETIEMYDAAIRDYELAQLFDQIPARSLLVLDSCFSGGFDTVIKRRTGRMGIFSSDSDLTSLVADKFEAGGYISMILQQALGGQADGDGNAAITAGELSEYMRSTFYQIASQGGLSATVYDRNARQVGSGYQHILVDRGGDGMPYEQVLLRLGAPRLAAR